MLMKKRRNPITVKDVALEAGVSTATVSRVINGDAKVRSETAEKVQKVLESSGYRMNQVARSLKTRKTHTIGIIAPEFKNDFFMSIVTGVEAVLKKEGYSVILCSSQENIDEEKARLRLLKEKSVDGVVIIPGSHEGSHFQIMEETPLVLIDRLVQNSESDTVLSDNFQGSYDSIKHAVNNGAHRIGFIGGDQNLSSAQERFEGYCKALEDSHIPLDEKLVLFGDYHEDSGYKLMKRLMEQKNAPSYIFISNYFMHLGAARYLLRTEHQGLHILSFDDLPLAAFFPYTSIIVAQPMEEIGRKAAEVLLKRIKGDKSPKKILRLPTSMRILE